MALGPVSDQGLNVSSRTSAPPPHSELAPPDPSQSSSDPIHLWARRQDASIFSATNDAATERISGLSAPRDVIATTEALQQTQLTPKIYSDSIMLVANRELARGERGEDGSITIRTAAGGLATAMRSSLDPDAGNDRVINVYSEIIGNQRMLSAVELLLAEQDGLVSLPCIPSPVRMDETVYSNFYEDVANGELWPLLHGMEDYIDYADEKAWQSYLEVNDRYAAQIISELQSDASRRVWIHDYHLMAVANTVRDAVPAANLGYFHHTPWPKSDHFDLLSENTRVDIVKGLLGNDLIGFHINEYRENFINCVRSLVRQGALDDVKIFSSRNEIMVSGRLVQLGVFPIGVDYKGIRERVRSPEVLSEEAALKAKYPGEYILFGIERLDFTKGIMQRLQAVRLMLNDPDYAHLRGHIRFVQRVAPSRMNVPAYKNLAEKVEELVHSINEEFRDENGWEPIDYALTESSMDRVLGWSRAADVVVVTPIRDGMNLVIKEAIAANDKPTSFVLGSGAGAAEELGIDCTTVNASHPINIKWGYIHALQDLESHDGRPSVAQIRLQRLHEKVSSSPVQLWAQNFMSEFAEATTSRWPT